MPFFYNCSTNLRCDMVLSACILPLLCAGLCAWCCIPCFAPQIGSHAGWNPSWSVPASTHTPTSPSTHTPIHSVHLVEGDVCLARGFAFKRPAFSFSLLSQSHTTTSPPSSTRSNRGGCHQDGPRPPNLCQKIAVKFILLFVIGCICGAVSALRKCLDAAPQMYAFSNGRCLFADILWLR